MENDFFKNKYGPKEKQTIKFMIPIYSIWKWFKKRKKTRRKK
jgi:hypothetical protein